MRRPALRLCRVTAAAAIAALLVTATVPASAQDLTSCFDLQYKERVDRVEIQFTGIKKAEQIGERFDLWYSFQGTDPTVVSATFDGEKRLWSSRPPAFKIQQIDLLPEVPGYSIVGPTECNYRVLDEPHACIAAFSFHAEEVFRVTVSAAGGATASFRARPGTAAARRQERCLPKVEWRRLSASDDSIAAEVRARLAADPALSPFAIDVDVSWGVVRLSGAVAEQDDRDLALRVASTVAGIGRVEDGMGAANVPITAAVLTHKALELWLSGSESGRGGGFPAVSIPRGELVGSGELILDREQVERWRYSGRPSRTADVLIDKKLKSLEGVKIERIEG